MFSSLLNAVLMATLALRSIVGNTQPVSCLQSAEAVYLCCTSLAVGTLPRAHCTQMPWY